MSELGKQLNPVQDKQYVGLFGLTTAQSEYFVGKDVRVNTQSNVFRKVIRNAELNYITPQSGVTTTALRIKFDNIELIYGYIHSFDGQPQLYCLSGHMLSQDGEYRKDLVPVRQYNATMRMFSEPVTMMTDHIRELVSAGIITLSTDVYGASINDATPNLGVLPHFILAMAWFIDKMFMTIGIVDKHIFGAREKLFADFPGGDKLYSRIRAIDGINWFQLMATSKYPDGQNASMNAGQKLIPLTTLALSSPHDITFAIWREIYINEMVSLLVMNNICTGFAYTPGWFYISGASARLFDGESSRRKYKNSAVAREIRDDVKTARAKTLVSDDSYSVDDPRHDIQSPINNQFAMLHSIITGSMKFTDSHLIMSSYALCMISIHTNVTVSNAAMLAKAYPAMNIMSLESFGRVLFDHLYALYCLNTRVNAMHADLHISNATIMRLNIDATATYDNTAYVIGQDIYSLPYRGMVGCVIDFSRAIVADTERLAREYTPAYAAAVQTAQSQSLADLIKRHFPAIHSQYGSRIRLLAEDHFDTFFRVCTIIDAYSLMCGINVMFDIQKEYQTSKYAKVNDDLRQHVHKIIDTSRDIFIRNMEALMRDPAAVKAAFSAKTPMLELIETIYGDKRISWPPPESDPVSHVINSNNELKYNAKDLNPLVDPTIEMEIRADIGIPRPEQTFKNRDYVRARAEEDHNIVIDIAKTTLPDDYDVEYTPPAFKGGDNVGAGVSVSCACGCVIDVNDTFSGGCECDDTCECAVDCAKNSTNVRGGANVRGNAEDTNNPAVTFGPVLL